MRRVVSKRRDSQGAHRANARCTPSKAKPKKISSDERIAAGGERLRIGRSTIYAALTRCPTTRSCRRGSPESFSD
jgi:hypothetical protein